MRITSKVEAFFWADAPCVEAQLTDFRNIDARRKTTTNALRTKYGILKQLTKVLLESARQVELSAHLGYEKHDAAGDNSGNSRNGTSEKTLKGDFGELPIEVPRDRRSEFEAKIVRKGQTRLDGFNEKILSLYARGLTTREIQQHIQEMYKVEVSPQLISNVTEAVMEDVMAWQNRPLEAIYPILNMDALQVKDWRAALNRFAIIFEDRMPAF